VRRHREHEAPNIVARVNVHIVGSLLALTAEHVGPVVPCGRSVVAGRNAS